ncbi:hypothetical protein PCO31110_04697 [Pandoraea communis]|uniref:Uncharacterized protein n=1 Tax=Pandoraea communis TaxID=2508297 RepID=A0A5E4YPG9_9BURK|nr:hypothetical protein [Pandoraea communis]VVE50160.1 hypothetical protein PCO31110_04697 [Pandoraea communis]
MEKHKLGPCALLVGVLLSTMASSNVNAQSLPPACQQYITAINVCGADLVKLIELRRPADLENTKRYVDTRELVSGMRAHIKSDGYDNVAQACATTAREELQKGIINITTMLTFGGGMTPRCQRAVGEIR